MPLTLNSAFAVDITLSGVEASTPRKRATALRKAFKFIGERHHRLYKMLKFSQSAYRRYGLRPRRKNYETAKRNRALDRRTGKRATGEVLPFVFTGTTRTLTRSGKRVTVTRVSEQGTCDANVFLKAPVLNFTPWLRAEFERVNNQELRAQARAGLKVFERELSKTRGRRKRQKR